ncbi:MAG: DUF3501 family protein, partial [Acaryochloridaceae cyanobacterium SU_2_1]|nr:DUF3501 family protein [Acaryochloridaceae cyanobacterium SU_2_1]
FLVAARGLETTIALTVGGETFAAHWDRTREQSERLSAVLYLKFSLSPHAVASICNKVANKASSPPFPKP